MDWEKSTSDVYEGSASRHNKVSNWGLPLDPSVYNTVRDVWGFSGGVCRDNPVSRTAVRLMAVDFPEDWKLLRTGMRPFVVPLLSLFCYPDFIEFLMLWFFLPTVFFLLETKISFFFTFWLTVFRVKNMIFSPRYVFSRHFSRAKYQIRRCESFL